MKSLVIKSLLVISAVALTSAFAWAAAPVDPCKDTDWHDDVVCNTQDIALTNGIRKYPANVEGSPLPPAGTCKKCDEARKAREARLTDKTNPSQQSAITGKPASKTDGRR